MSRRDRGLWSSIKRDKTALAGAMLLSGFFLIAVFGIFLTTGREPLMDPKKVRLTEKLKPPLSKPSPETLSSERPLFDRFILGTDELGRDVLARMLQGAYVSMSVGFISVGISVLIGIVLGGLAGYFGERPVGLITLLLLLALLILGVVGIKESDPFSLGAIAICLIAFYFRNKGPLRRLNRGLIDVDSMIMRLVDIMLCFPSFFLILTVVALLPPSIYNIMVVIGLTSWMGTARFVRAEFLALRELEYVKAAKLLGLSEFRIIFIHMLPNAMGPVLVSATIGIASAILVEAGLSFLGLGVPPPHATWGNILSDGKNYLFDAPWLTFVPGLAIMIVVLSFNMLGESLRDIINPRLRA